MLLSIVIPPVNVPAPITIVSPSCATFTAGWICAKQPAGRPTHSVAPAAGRAAAPSRMGAIAATSSVRVILYLTMVIVGLLSARGDPDGLDDALAGHARVLARALDGRTRGGVEQAEDELVAGEVERSPEGRLWPLPGVVPGLHGREPEARPSVTPGQKHLAV